ncbi:S1 family peptidase [Phytohabitans kaempferiae]|uniref:S1 family peptidase n=1 Tax=Phytohabitans kaempferiae TaxID=1620943 RepID=A0ABV6M9C0_9ACTN
MTSTSRQAGRATRLLAAAGAALLAAALLAAPAGAAPPRQLATDTGLGADPLEAVANAYLATHPDLSPVAALAAATAQANSEKLKLALADRLSTFGGGWFDPYTSAFHIAVTTPAAAGDAAALGRDLGLKVKTHQVARSLDQLKEQAEKLRGGGDALGRAAAGHVGIDVRTNEVVVALPPPQLSGFASAAVPAGVRLEANTGTRTQNDACTSREDCDNNLRAGLRLRRSGALWCSAGFTARGSTGIRWQLTAGHCVGTIGETWSNGTTTQRNIGPLTDSIDSGVVDASAIQVTNAFYSADTVGRIATGASSFAPVTGETFLLVNDVVCLSASTTDPTRSGNPCGTVTSLSDSARRGQVRVEGYDACGGDSGGGWYWLPGSGNRWAVGLHSGSLTGCNVTPGVSWLSPLDSFWTALTYETG